MPAIKGKDLPYYNSLERNINYISHLVGAVISLVFSIILLIKVFRGGASLKILWAMIYCLALINMFCMSTVYHYFTDDKIRKKLQKLDHISISILIAGSLTPLLMSTINSTTSKILCYVAWGLCAVCVICNLINVKKFMAVTLISYIVMGWMVAFMVKDLYLYLTPYGFYLLLCGGITYTIGIIFFGMTKINYMHAVWHFFVLIGSMFIMACQYFFAI